MKSPLEGKIFALGLILPRSPKCVRVLSPATCLSVRGLISCLMRNSSLLLRANTKGKGFQNDAAAFPPLALVPQQGVRREPRVITGRKKCVPGCPSGPDGPWAGGQRVRVEGRRCVESRAVQCQGKQRFQQQAYHPGTKPNSAPSCLPSRFALRAVFALGEAGGGGANLAADEPKSSSSEWTAASGSSAGLPVAESAIPGPRLRAGRLCSSSTCDGAPSTGGPLPAQQAEAVAAGGNAS